MNKRVLFVDDESNVLDAIKRAIRKDCDVTIAVGPEEGLAAIASSEPFALIVSDMRMPGMDGVEFLRAAKQLAPEAVRMMLTGNADQQTAVSAVNDGEVYRYLTKPCDVQGLRQAVAQGLEQHALVTAEKSLLEGTLTGSIQVLTDVLALARPDVFGRSSQSLDRVESLLAAIPELGARDVWAIRTAARLARIGSISLRPSALAKLNAGEPLDEAERAAFFAGAGRAADLLEQIPRLEEVADIIRYQHKQYTGAGWPEDSLRAESIPVGSRALYLAGVEESLRGRGYDAEERAEELQARASEFDPRLLARLLQDYGQVDEEPQLRDVTLRELEVGMKLASDVTSKTGSLLVCAGQVVTNAVAEHLKEMERTGGVQSPIQIVDDGAQQTDAVVNG
ncbi:MAG: HD domain-containing phosphohydrolase [Pseudomonadota bacterium]